MNITLQTRYTDGTVQHERCTEADDLTALLSHLAANWHPAQAGRVPGTDRFYLNNRLLISIDGAEFEPVYSMLARLHTPVGLAA
ncbi:MAG: hypothetical protein QM681_19635 [Novosphingobium sp.]